MSTPTDIAYSTPHDSQPTLRNTFRRTLQWFNMLNGHLHHWNFRPYIICGWSGTDVQGLISRLYREAQVLERTEKTEDAELKLREALTGLENLLTPTHEETKKGRISLSWFLCSQQSDDRRRYCTQSNNRCSYGTMGIKHKKPQVISSILQTYFTADLAQMTRLFFSAAHQRLTKSFSNMPSPPRPSPGKPSNSLRTLNVLEKEAHILHPRQRTPQ